MADDTRMKQDDFTLLRKLPGNVKCVDCGKKNPDWGSPKLGVLMCLDCSGRHRGLGTHLSFVRSVAMDRWTDKQIKLMSAGGNQKLNDFLREHGVKIDSHATAKEKYDNPAAELYRQKLAARVEGRLEPTELPEAPDKTAKKKMDGFGSKKMEGFGSKKMEGFGSSPPPEPPFNTARNVAIGVVAVAAIGAYIFSGSH